MTELFFGLPDNFLFLPAEALGALAGAARDAGAARADCALGEALLEREELTAELASGFAAAEPALFVRIPARAGCALGNEVSGRAEVTSGVGACKLARKFCVSFASSISWACRDTANTCDAAVCN